ncbi:DUF7919 family protein [Streptomyces sp. NPDC005004]
MTHYPDLSAYEYNATERKTLNVGWLSREHPYATGEAPAGLVDVLAELARNAVNADRGMHFCELCPDFPTAREHTSRGDVFIGGGEIRVTGEQGVEYTSPAMVVHYVEDHSYLPPDDYCTAVLAATS